MRGRPSFLTTLGIFITTLFAVPAAAAPKVDTVVLENGDRLTCELKGLQRGRLSIGTDALDTVKVYWALVEHVASPRLFEVETASGARYFGTLVDAGPRRIGVAAGGAPIDLPMNEVVRLMPIEATFWQRIDGHIDLGFSVTKASNETRWTLNSDGEYRGRRWVGSATLASQLTTRQDADRLSRQTLTLNGGQLYGNRWFTIGLAQFQQNEELSLDLRSVVGAGVGRSVVQSNTLILRLYTGLVYTRERFTAVPTRNSPEAAVGAIWNWFTARNSDLDLSTTAVSYFNVGGSARTRIEFQSAFRVAFLSDFYFSVNGYDSYDSLPPSDRTANDYGLNLALGWKF